MKGAARLRDARRNEVDARQLRWPREPQGRETWRTWANLVTGLRTVAGLGCFAIAAASGSAAWNYAGLAVYWSLDVADGMVARWLRQETRIGAQLDILCDRVLIASFYANLLHAHPALAVPIALHLLQFVVIDQYLSYQFIRWPLLSPNYFHEVDRTVWLLNWSTAGKLANGGLVTLAVVATALAGWSWVIPATVSLAVIASKVLSIVLMQRIPAPELWAGRAGAE